MKKILVIAASMLVVPAISLAATYHYVNVNGQVSDVSAANANQAFALATDIAPHSGVAIDTGTINAGDTVVPAGSGASAPTVAGASAATYQYVNVNGQVKTVAAANAASAFALATDIAPHSGVVSVAASGTVIPSGTYVSNTAK